MRGKYLIGVFSALFFSTSLLQADAIPRAPNDITDEQKDEQQSSKSKVQTIKIMANEVAAENTDSFAPAGVEVGNAASTLYTGLGSPQNSGRDSQIDRPRKQFQYNGNGFVYFATGVCQHGYKILGVGGGGEGFIWKGLTIGGELSFNQFVDDARFSLASLRLGYHFVDRSRPKKIDPFVNFSVLGGYLAGGIGPTASIGGGTYYWFKERIGLRTEVRYHALPCESLILFRIGVGIR